MSDNFLGKDFDYMNAFYKPLEAGGPGMGTSSSDIYSNIKGTIAYGSALVSQEEKGKTKVQKNGGVLGNAYFLSTNVDCPKEHENEDVTAIRHIYISNRPTGKIDALDDLFPDIPAIPQGLLPGMMSNIQRTNPSGLLNAVLPANSDDSKCHAVTLNTYDQQANGKVTLEAKSNYMSKYDICQVDKSNFSDYVESSDTSSSKSIICETFSSMNQPIEEEIEEENNYSKMPDDQLMQLYLSSLTLLGLYLVLKFINKR